MLSILNVRADQHNSCEDSVHVEENDRFIAGVVADGCSTGIKSHFASQVVAYFIEKEQYADVTADYVIEHLKNFLSGVRVMFGFSHMNLLSTCILFFYDKHTKVLKVRVLGDGVYFINTDHQVTVDQGNTPDYLAYHLNDTDEQFERYLDKHQEKVYINVDKFMICSDGIERIGRTALQAEPTIDKLILWEKPASANYLIRMWNRLKRDGYLLSDDLTIVSYVSDKS